MRFYRCKEVKIMIDLLSSAFAGTGVGAILSFGRVWMAQKHEFLLSTQKNDYSAIADARESKNPEVQFTRRVLAIMIFAYFCLLPLLSSYLGWPTFVSFEETNGTISSLFNGDSNTIWRSFPPGFVITPAHTYVWAQVTTMYFIGRSKI